MKFENILALYWSNIKRFWKTSFYDHEWPHSIYDKKINELYYKESRTPEEEIWYLLLKQRDYLHSDNISQTEVGALPFWIIEFILFIPNIILFPFIRTIIDVYTRRHQTQESIVSLVSSLNELFHSNPEDFDTLVEVLSFNQGSNKHIFKSLNSQDLIADLHFARVEEQIKPQILELADNVSQLDKQKIVDLFDRESSSSLYKTYPRNNIKFANVRPRPKLYEDDYEDRIQFCFQGDSLLYRIIYYSRQKDSIDLEHQNQRREKQLSFIVDYLKNPENNGSKLAQYFQVNIMSLQNNKSTRETSLKAKAKIECDRLGLIASSSSSNKKTYIEEVITSETLHEKKLMRALLYHRGCGFFGNMTSSFDNVYCTDISIKPQCK